MKTQITVTIPAQKYDKDKYLGHGCRCYLEEALDKAGYPGSIVHGVGRTTIGNQHYVPRQPFGGGILKAAFDRGESVTVTLV